jgi:DNA polymerase-3 subunit gamma/tau
MSQALYRKWRPARFDQVIGQAHVTNTLQKGVSAGRIGHAYLFCGPRGTGKTTLARLLAKAVNCLDEDPAMRPCNQCAICQAVNEGRFLDLIEIDAASNTGVDDIRSLRDKINFSPTQGRYKVYIIDEVHMLSTAAFNALLKTLEEPPAHAIFVLATTEEHKVPVTIKSRCQQFNFRLLSGGEISSRLEWLAEQESLDVEAEVLELIARQAEGSLRDAESLLDQLIAGPDDQITLERAQMILGTATSAAVVGLADAWLDGDGAAGLRIIHEALASGADARQFCRQMVNHLRQLLLLRAAGAELPFDGPLEHKETMLIQAQRASQPALLEAVKRFQEAALRPLGNWQPQLPLELAFIELLPDKPFDLPPLTQPETKQNKPAKPTMAATPSDEDNAKHHHPTVSRQKSVNDVPERAANYTVPPGDDGRKRPRLTRDDDKATLSEQSAVTESTLTLADVSKLWRKMVERVGQRHKNLPPLLGMCRPLAVDGKWIILGFDYPIFKDKFDKMEGAAQAVTAAYRELTSTDCIIRLVVTSEYTVPIAREEFDALAEELGGVVRDEL